jgi:hypothetical protein
MSRLLRICLALALLLVVPACASPSDLHLERDGRSDRPREDYFWLSGDGR